MGNWSSLGPGVAATSGISPNTGPRPSPPAASRQRVSVKHSSARNGSDGFREPGSNLNETQRLIVETVRKWAPIQGKEIAKKAGLPFNSYLRTTIAWLVKHDLLRKASRGDGYTV